MRKILTKFSMPLIVAFWTTAACAQVENLVGQKVMIVKWGVEAHEGDQVTRELQLSEVFEVAKTKGDLVWFNESVGGWVNKQHVVPLEHAVDHFSRLIENDHSGINYYHRGLAWLAQEKYKSALDDANIAIRLGAPLQGLFLRGEVFRRTKHYQKAIVSFSYALSLKSCNPSALNSRGQSWFEMGEFDRAVADFTYALELDAEDSIARNNRACALMRAGQKEQALRDYDHIIRNSPENAQAIYNRAVLLYETGEYKKAIGDYRKVLDLDSDHFKARTNLAWIFATCFDADHRNSQQAVELATRACEQSEWNDDHALAVLAAAYACDGNFEKAQDYLTKAVELDPKASRPIRDAMHALFSDDQPFIDSRREIQETGRVALDALRKLGLR